MNISNAAEITGKTGEAYSFFLSWEVSIVEDIFVATIVRVLSDLRIALGRVWRVRHPGRRCESSEITQCCQGPITGLISINSPRLIECLSTAHSEKTPLYRHIVMAFNTE